MRVFLVEDSVIVREWIKKLLSDLEEIEIIGETREPIKAIGQIRELKPDAVILDMRARKRLGVDLLGSIRELIPSPMIIMLTHRFYRPSLSGNAASGADFILDKFSEWHKISDILKPSVRRRPQMECSSLSA